MTPPTKHRGTPNTPDTPLSRREQAFVAEYCVCFSPTRAARAVGYKGANVHITASRLYHEPHIQAAIDLELRERSHRIGLTADRALHTLAELYFEPIPNMRDLFDAKNNLKPLSRLTPAETRMIASFEVVKQNITAGDGKVDVVHKVKLWDVRASKRGVAELVLRCLGLLDQPADAAGDVPAFQLPPETPGVRVH